MVKKITVVLVDRANYGRLQPIIEELYISSDFNLSLVWCGSTVLKRFHKPSDYLLASHVSTHHIYHEVEESPVLSMSMLMPQLVVALNKEQPDYVLIIGDRFEALAVATVAFMMGLCVIHVQGGEFSGNIDDSIRHSITKLAHYHLPATEHAKDTLLRMGEQSDAILTVGCPSADLAKQTEEIAEYKDKVLCVYHPESYVDNESRVKKLLRVLEGLEKPVMMFWPNIDEGSVGISKVLRAYIEEKKPEWLQMLVNVSPEHYQNILRNVLCCVGNSSSFVRDASFYGTSVVLVGDRQLGRIQTDNVRYVRDCSSEAVLSSVIREQMKRTYQPSIVFGKPGISKKFVSVLRFAKPYKLKKFC